MCNDTSIPSNCKPCAKCGKVKPLDDFHNLTSSPDGKQPSCKACAHQNYLDRKSRHKKPPSHKTCSVCGETFPIDQFHLMSSSKDGYRTQCKNCCSKRHKEYAKNPTNKEKMAQRNADWYRRNREAIRNRQNTRYATLPRIRSASSEKQCLQCGETLPAAMFHKKRDSADGLSSICLTCKRDYDARYRPEYYARPTFRIIAARNNSRRRARTGGAKGTHTKDDLKIILKRQKGRCYWCLKDMGDKWTVDHRIPLSRGGSNNASNLVLCCAHCNSSKSNKMPWEWNGRLL